MLSGSHTNALRSCCLAIAPSQLNYPFAPMAAALTQGGASPSSLLVACFHATALPLSIIQVVCVLQAFSQLGGLQLDRDIRSLVAAAGELTSRPVRDKFARLTQVWLAAYRLRGCSPFVPGTTCSRTESVPQRMAAN